MTDVNSVPKDKKAIVFDLDGTLALSKVGLDPVMAGLLIALIKKYSVAIISGGSFERFKIEVIDPLAASDEPISSLFLFPLNAGAFYELRPEGWAKIYSLELLDSDKEKIKEAFEKVFSEINYVHPKYLYGEEIEDRGSQLTFSALGQEAPLEEKEKWLKEHAKEREKIAAELRKLLPEMDVAVAGLTSIDVTQKGVNKKLGIERFAERLGIQPSDILFVGDALEPGGNDAPALAAGAVCVKVNSIEDTAKLIKSLL